MTSYFDYLGALDSPGKVAPRGQGQRFRAQGVKGLFSHPSGGSPASGGLFGGGGGAGDGSIAPINTDETPNPFSEIDVDQTSQDAISALYESGEANLGSIGNVMQEQRDREIAEQMEAARAEEAAKQQAIYEAQMEQQRLENEKAMQEQIEQQSAIQAQLDEINNRPVVEPVVQPEPTLPQENVPVAEQIDGSLRPVTGDPLLTDAPAQTGDEVNVLPTVTGDTFAGGGSQPVTTPTPPASRPGINIVPGAGGDIGLTIDGKTPGQLILGSKPGQTIVNQLPPVLTTGPGTFPMPTGTPTHINTGGTGGFGGTGIGVLAPIAGGKPTVYGTWDANQVADLMEDPIGVLSAIGGRLGESIGGIWDRIKDLLTLEQQKQVQRTLDKDEEKDGEIEENSAPVSFTGFTDPGSVSDYYKDVTLQMDDRPFYATGGKSPLSAWDIPEGRGLPYSKFPVDSDVYGDILIDQLKPDPNTLSSEIDRMVASSLPFVSVTGDDGTQYMYDKQTQQTYSLPDYMDLVEKRNTIGLPPGVNRMPGRLPSYGGYGYG